MNKCSKISLGLILILPIFLANFALSQQAREANPESLPPAANIRVDFTRDIEPILRERCQTCHGAKLQTNGLRLDSRTGALAGGYTGPAINPGDSAESKLIQMVAGVKKGLIMPPIGERLAPEQVGLLRAWIDQGAEWPETTTSKEPGSTRSEAAGKEGPKPKTKHWSFVAPRRPPPPTVQNPGWCRNPIDAFVLARLEAEGIRPSPEADGITLIRRLSLDLTGLPPTPEEVAQFLEDKRPEAYEQLVDRLLASPHYGEKWARHWLDLARYADSDGYETDQLRPYAWRYRHWLIEALNRDMPFDQFTIAQIAGDMLPTATVEQKVATGFHRNTLSNREGGADVEEYRNEQVVDRISTIGATWLGLTVGCARCHDHKYDPISQKEFYQLFAFFNNADEINIEAPLPGEIGPYLQSRPEYLKKRQELLAPYAAELTKMQTEWEKKVLEADANPGKNATWDRAWELVVLTWGGNLGWGQLEGLSILKLDPSQRTERQKERLQDYFLRMGSQAMPEEFKALKIEELVKRSGEGATEEGVGKLDKLQVTYPSLTEAPTLYENPQPRKTHILIRGDFRDKGTEVQPNTPAVLPPLPANEKPTRLSLARWLVSPEHPLTSRVAVNHFWQEFFGQGLVTTSEDFGIRGSVPSHPELLDWLATEFMAQGWSMKRIQKLIVMSATYRQSSKARPDLETRDPNNTLLARQSRVRLPAELIRDSGLAVSGLLSPTIGGPSVRPPQPPAVAMQAFEIPWVESKGPDRYRRGLYTFIHRTAPFAQSVTFDGADPNRACPRRERSNTPLQALTLLNDPVFFEMAQALAVRILKEKPGSLTDRIDYGYRLCLGRGPSSSERNRLVQYFRAQIKVLQGETPSATTMLPYRAEGVNSTEAAAWVGLSSVLLNQDEFITRE